MLVALAKGLIMNQEERIAFFDEKYTSLFSGPFGSGDKLYIGQKSTICRFCKKTPLETAFNNISHAIPEFLGNKQFILYEECDECNKLFSESLEDSLDKYTKPYRTLSQIKGKKKVPKYKSNDGKNRIELAAPGAMEIRTDIDDEFCEIDDANNQIRLNPHLEPHIPAAVYKALVKIALSIIPSSELGGFQHAINWICERDHTKEFITPLMVMVTFIPGPRPNTQGAAFVLKRKAPENGLPYCIFVFAFSNFIYQLQIPSIHDLGESGTATIKMPYFPNPFEHGWEYGNPQYGVFDLSKTSVVKDANAPIILKYGHSKNLQDGN